MIDIRKIKAGDKVQIDGSPNWRGVLANKPAGIEIFFSGFLQKIHHDLITGHLPAEPVVPKGEGCVDWDKDVWCLYHDGDILKLNNSADCRNMILQGNVSNNRQHLERKRDRQRIEQELLECDGAVYEPVPDREGRYWGIDTDGDFDATKIKGEAIRYYICNFMNSRTAEAALEKVGAERIRKAWGSDDDK